MHKNGVLKKSDVGFTLTELIVSIIILSIIAALAIPKFTYIPEKAKAGEGIDILNSVLQAQKIYKLENGSYTNDFANLDITVSPKYFFTPLDFSGLNLNPDVGVVTRVEAGVNLYELKITDTGIITCNPLAGPLGICTKIGY